MKKSLITVGLCLSIGVFLQFILIETSPRILCSEILGQLKLLLKSLVIEYIVLGALLLIGNKFILKLKKRESLISLAVFTAIYILVFSYMFYDYANKCVQGTIERRDDIVPGDKQGVGTGGGHTLDSYDYIFEKPKDKKGYVAPRKDVQENGGGIYHLIIMILIFIGGSCKRLEEQMQCLQDQQKEIKDTDVYKTVYSAFSDTLHNWINWDLEYVKSLKESDWKVDSTILFNTTRDKCLLFFWIGIQQKAVVWIILK